MNDFDPANIKIVEIDRVRPNEWNPKLKETDEYKKVVESIQVNGLRQPILVREHGDGYEIVDGEQRFTACKELGFEKIYVYDFGQVSDEKAKSLTIWFEVQTPFDEMQLAPLVVELSEMGVPIPYDEDEVIDFKNLADFEFVDDGLEPFVVKCTPEQFDLIWEIVNEYSAEHEVENSRAVIELIEYGVKRYE